MLSSQLTLVQVLQVFPQAWWKQVLEANSQNCPFENWDFAEGTFQTTLAILGICCPSYDLINLETDFFFCAHSLSLMHS